ncbi:N-acetylglucosamine-6-phosphate deacetylase [Holdemania massiliensis]|uniref:N-acetylglucosamine-6-phosphate deacetylase n=1 Tax=Holdemania massiliensis TaxID=1468449 RepID=UPI001F061D98|nr:amidohydrolase family protein [Holdemania massiliensis]MCH1939659.1 amidohydrolase family protein [Holdemania massiliensis]
MKYIKSSRIYFEDGVRDGILVLDQGRFAGFLAPQTHVSEVLDFGDQRIIPGIFDTHNHGTYGYALNPLPEQSKESIDREIRGYLKALTYEGVTSVFPTCEPPIIENTARIAEEKPIGAQILGIHSEGPYLNRVGENGRPMPSPPVDMEVVRKMVADACGKLRLVALAPEIEGIQEAMQYFLKHDVKLAFAHSDLKSEGTKQAIAQGITVATHLSNVMTGLHHRDLGALGTLLMSDQVDCELICDGLHVSLDFIGLLLKIKDSSRFMMISDSSELAGLKPGVYDSFWPLPITVDEQGYLKDADGRLCGSSKSVLFGMGNLVEKLGLPLEQVIRMASLNPARIYGFDAKKGSIAFGKDADFVVISEDYQARATFVGGKCVYDAAKEERIFNPELGSIRK